MCSVYGASDSLGFVLAVQHSQLLGREKQSACRGRAILQIPCTENKATACIGDVDGHIAVVGHGNGQNTQNGGVYASVGSIRADEVTEIHRVALLIHLGQMQGAGIGHAGNVAHFCLHGILADNAVDNEQEEQKTDCKQCHECHNIFGKYALKHIKYSPSEDEIPRGSR